MGYTVSSVPYGKCRGLKRGDTVTHMNGEPFCDMIDLAYFMASPAVELTVSGKRGVRRLTVTGDELASVNFEGELLGPPRECGNKCVFCFVHQLPRGMRRTLYVRDDDWRYSLLYGNYVTFADISDDELSRIVRRQACPLYVSVHAKSDDIRRKLLGNPNARSLHDILDTFVKNGISFHAQIVLTPGYNDGGELEAAVEWLYGMYPVCRSLAVVPVGLTAHREHLTPLRPVEQADAAAALDFAEAFAGRAIDECGTRFVFASDEMYIRAGRRVPDTDWYEDFCQIDNGVGLVAQLMADADAEMLMCEGEPYVREMSAACGVDVYPYARELADRLEQRFDVTIHVYAVRNDFFGHTVTVSGLVAGCDLAAQLAGKPLGGLLMLPRCMLRDKTDVFLDDMTVQELSETLGVEINSDGIETLPFVRQI